MGNKIDRLKKKKTKIKIVPSSLSCFFNMLFSIWYTHNHEQLPF